MKPTKKTKNSNLTTIEELKETVSYTPDFVRCLVVNEETATHGYRRLSKDIIPPGSIPVIDDGIPTHYLTLNGTLSPMVREPDDSDMPTATDEDGQKLIDGFTSPEDCFEAQFWDELEFIQNLNTPLIEKIKLGIFVGLIVCLIIVLFLLAVMVMG